MAADKHVNNVNNNRPSERIITYVSNTNVGCNRPWDVWGRDLPHMARASLTCMTRCIGTSDHSSNS